jgi:hypothetical protein
MTEDEESRITQIAWVQKSLEDMNKQAGTNKEDTEESVVFLLTALIHYCDFHDLSFSALKEKAERHYDAESSRL